MKVTVAQEKAPDHPYNVIDPQSIIADVSIEVALKIRHGMDPEEALKCENSMTALKRLRNSGRK